MKCLGLASSHVSHLVGAFGLEANLSEEVLAQLTMNLYVAYTACKHIRNTGNTIGDYFTFGNKPSEGLSERTLL